MAKKEKRFVMWFYDPAASSPNWDWWGFAETKEEVERDRGYVRARGHKFFVTEIEFPVPKK